MPKEIARITHELCAAAEWARAGRSLPEAFRDKSAKASRQGVIAALIVETEAGPLNENVVESPGGLSVGEGR